MAKAKITFIVVKEYEIKPKYYPGCVTLEEMLAVDISSASDDPYLTIGDDSNWAISGEIIER